MTPDRCTTIVIPAWNLWEYTRACLESLASCAKGAPFHIVVVDNGSTDATAEHCAPLGEHLFPGRFTHLRLERNLGFAQGCNAGAKTPAAAKSAFLLFLNNDTNATPGWLETLLATMEAPGQPVAASPLLLYPRVNRVQHACIGFDPNMHPVHPFHYFPGRHPALDSLRSPQALSAAALMVRRSEFEAVGGFCPEYMNGSEDIDLCCQLQKRGGKFAFARRAILHHATSKTPGRWEHTAHNARLLNTRARGCFLPDLHRHAARAGFTLSLTPWLEPLLAMRTPLPEHLDTAGQTPRELGSLLEQEPLWEAGYRRITGLLQNEAPTLALQWGEAWALLRPSFEALENVLKLAQACDDPVAIERWSEALRKNRELVAHTRELRSVAQQSMEWCRKNGQKEVEKLYKDWLDGPAESCGTLS